MEAGVMTGAPSVAQTRTTILGDKLVQNVEVPLTGVSASSLAGVPMVGLGSAPPNIHLEIPAQSSGYQFSASPDALIRTRYPDPDEAKARFAILAARVAVLEATLAAGSAGVGHNRGPSFDGKLDVDEKEIQEFIDRLKAQSATALVDLPKLMEAARVADPTINKWHERRDEFVKGVLKGVGTGMAIPIGKEIAEQLGLASKFSAVFSALQSVFEAFTAWLSLFLSLS
jgi:hypothetical protein